MAVRAFAGNRHQAFFSVLDGHGTSGAEVLAAAVYLTDKSEATGCMHSAV